MPAVRKKPKRQIVRAAAPDVPIIGGVEVPYDWKNPDYAAVFRYRIENIRRLRGRHKAWKDTPEDQRQGPDPIEQMKTYYGSGPEGISDFITDWGVTFDPRNADIGLPTVIPMILFKRQREFVSWIFDRWTNRRPGLCEKSRDMGVTWLTASVAASLCALRHGVAFGFGSRVVDLVDKVNTMKPILPKARMFMEYLPEEFSAGFVPWRDGPYMRLNFPDTGSIIMGEGGDNIGRGDRASLYVVDEKAYCANQEAIDHSLSQTTNCQIDVSSVCGMNNHFAQKRHAGRVDVFVFDWHDDPRKDDAWYAKMQEDLDPVTVAQEIDRDYSASLENIVLPGKWVRACLDAAEKIGIEPTGERLAMLDVADQGIDKNALLAGKGIEIDFAQEWSGKGADMDIYATVEKAFALCDDLGIRRWRYDADGLGAGVRGDARKINEQRKKDGLRMLQVDPYRGSGAVHNPEGQWDDDSPDQKGRLNKDMFFNAKAQAWWLVRKRVLLTYRWIVEGIECDKDDILSINTKKIGPAWKQLTTEMSQATFGYRSGKIVVDKKPDGLRSPNFADGLVGKFAPIQAPMSITSDMLKAAAVRRR